MGQPKNLHLLARVHSVSHLPARALPSDDAAEPTSRRQRAVARGGAPGLRLRPRLDDARRGDRAPRAVAQEPTDEPDDHAGWPTGPTAAVGPGSDLSGV